MIFWRNYRMCGSHLEVKRFSVGTFGSCYQKLNSTRCPNLTHLELLTNGMLFDRRQWNTFRNLHYLKILLVISIDASSKETFEFIRRNGRWERMLANLEFASTFEGIEIDKTPDLIRGANRELPGYARSSPDGGAVSR